MLPTLEGKVSHIPLNNHSLVILLPLYLGSLSHFFPFSCFLLDTPFVVLPFFCLLLLSITYLAFFDLFHSCCYPSSQINLVFLSLSDNKIDRRDVVIGKGDQPCSLSPLERTKTSSFSTSSVVSRLSTVSVRDAVSRRHTQQ